MNDDSNNPDEHYRSERLRRRRLERRSKSFFGQRRQIEKNRRQIKSYEESNVVLGGEDRKEALYDSRQNANQEEAPSSRPLPPIERQQELPPPPPNRFIKPTDIGRSG